MACHTTSYFIYSNYSINNKPSCYCTIIIMLFILWIKTPLFFNASNGFLLCLEWPYICREEEKCLIFKVVFSLVYLIEWESPCTTPHWYLLRAREPKAEVTGSRAKPPFEQLNYIQQQVFQLSRVDACATLLFKFPDETQCC